MIHTLYTSDPFDPKDPFRKHENFFLVPEDITLFPGDTVYYVAITGVVFHFDPKSIEPFRVTCEETHQYLTERKNNALETTMRDLGDGISRMAELYREARDVHKRGQLSVEQQQQIKDIEAPIFRELGKQSDKFFSSLLANIHGSEDITPEDVEEAAHNDSLMSELVAITREGFHTEMRRAVEGVPDLPIDSTDIDPTLAPFWLVVLHNAQQIHVYPLQGNRIVVGRKSKRGRADIQIQGALFGREHFIIEAVNHPDYPEVAHVVSSVDEDPEKALYLNGWQMPAHTLYPLQSGDILRAGHHFFRYIRISDLDE